MVPLEGGNPPAPTSLRSPLPNYMSIKAKISLPPPCKSSPVPVTSLSLLPTPLPQSPRSLRLTKIAV